MFVMLRKMVVKEGHADEMINRFSQPGILEEQEGFVDTIVMKSKARKGEESVVVAIRWESEAMWKQWEKSDAHLAGHREKRNQPKPEYVISTEVDLYTVEAVKEPVK